MADLESVVARLEAVTGKLEKMVLSGAVPAAPVLNGVDDVEMPPPEVIEEFDAIIKGPLAQWVSLSEQLAPEVGKAAQLTKAAFDESRVFLCNAVGMAKPGDNGAALLKPVGDKIEEIQKYKMTMKNRLWANHVDAIEGGITAVAWVSVSPTPVPFIKEANDASQFYTNRILKEFKGKEQKQVDWVHQWHQIWSELQAYVKQRHTTGVSWNCAAGYKPGGASARGPSPGGPCAPAPPPPPPSDLYADLQSGSGGGGAAGGQDARAELFAQINQGLGITSGLKKVTDDQKTHKNPGLRGSADVAKKSSTCCKPPPVAPKPGAGGAPAKPPVLELEGGKKWKVDYHRGNKNLKVNADMKHTLYMYQCTDSVLVISGKINSVTIDGCKKCQVQFDSVVSQVEVINSQGIKLFSMGALPTCAVQKTDGCQIFLSKESVACEIVSSKSSEMNVNIPHPSIEGDFTELAVPEIFRTIYKDGKLETSPVDVV